MDVMEAVRTRRSVRKYSPRPIPEDVLAEMREALRCAPSACNNQPWHFVLVVDPDRRRELVETACGKWSWMLDAPLIVVACGLDGLAYQRMGGSGSSMDVDVAIALDHLTLAAVARGLGTCWIGAFDEVAAKKVLGVPETVKIVAMTPLGYPAAADLNRPLEPDKRKDPSEIFSIDRYAGAE